MPIWVSNSDGNIRAKVPTLAEVQDLTGPTGPRGATGAQGPAGADGAAATVSVGSVTTGDRGSAASVVNTGTSNAAILNFTIPRGATGAAGATGPAGETGPAGPTGATGAQGPAGAGVPTGGTSGQVLKKKSASDYDTGWADAGSGAVSSVAGRTGDVVLTKSDVGLGSVDNTSDANKPVSTAAQTALDAKVPTSRTINGYSLTGNITLTGADIGANFVLLHSINTGSGSSSVSVDVSADTAYTALRIYIDIMSTYNGVNLSIRFNSDSSSKYYLNSTSASTELTILPYVSAGHISGVIDIVNPFSTTTSLVKSIGLLITDDTQRGITGWGQYYSSSAISSIQFRRGGSFSSNVVARIYGIK